MDKKLIFPILLILLFSCTETIDYGLGDYRVELVTIVENVGGRFYQLDNQDSLLPDVSVNSSLKSGSRALLNYNIAAQKGSKSYNIKVNSAIATNTGSIKIWTNNLPDDPLRIDGVWLKGDWLNLRLAFSYHTMRHSIDLFRRPSLLNDTLFLDLRHSKNGDNEGYFINTYVSFNLKAFAKKDTIPVKVRANSLSGGEQLFYFKYTTPAPN